MSFLQEKKSINRKAPKVYAKVTKGSSSSFISYSIIHSLLFSVYFYPFPFVFYLNLNLNLMHHASRLTTYYSYLSASTGFLVAALQLCKLTVIKAMPNAIMPASAKTHQLNPV